MKDRISTYPHRVTLTPVEGQENTYDLVRADEPIEVGTPLNKASLLSDDTATAMRLSQSNPTVNDALSSLSGSVVSVGDMKTTMRTDLDDKWLLCNGEKFSQQEYPELYNLLSTKLSGVFFAEEDLWGNNENHRRGINCVTYSNGYWVVGGSYGDSSNGSYSARIAYSTSLSGPWTTKDLWTSTSSAEQEINDVVYKNGYWTTIGRADSAKARIAYSTSLSGPWTTKDLWTRSESGTTTNAYCITYANGYWVAGGRHNDDAIVKFATDLNGTWTRYNVWNGINYPSSVRDVAYANGYWIAVGDGEGGREAQIAYSTNLTTWESKELFSGSLECVIYADGKWIVGGGTDNSGNNKAVIYSAATPDGKWESKTITDGSVKCLTYQNGIFVAGITRNANSDCVLAYGTSLESEWAIKKSWDGKKSYTSINDFAYANGLWLLGGQYGDGTNAYARIAYSDGVALPICSTGDSYTYIRAEGATT